MARAPEDILKARGVKPTLSPNLNVLATVEALDVKRLLFIGVGCQVCKLLRILGEGAGWSMQSRCDTWTVFFQMANSFLVPLWYWPRHQAGLLTGSTGPCVCKSAWVSNPWGSIKASRRNTLVKACTRWEKWSRAAAVQLSQLLNRHT